MAHIDDLIQRIADKTLRNQVADEVGKILERKDFGLVFQRHLPEDIEVPGVRPRRGDEVRLRRDAEKQNHLVLSVRADAAEIVAIDNSKKPVTGIKPESIKLNELVVVKDFNTEIYPGLHSISAVNRGGTKPYHIVIEGENYHALETLLYTHEQKVDVIYIDPPYNTGSDEWIYNDRYVVQTDLYRHSKWLSFIERRLLHAKRLLRDSGVIFVAIGDDEHHRLRMLLDEIFGEQNFIANVAWQGGVSALAKHTGGGLDYMLVYGRNSNEVKSFRDPKPFAPEMLDIVAAALHRGANPDEAQQELARYIKSKSKEISIGLARFNKVDEAGRIYLEGDLANSLYRPNLRYPITNPESGRVYEPPANGWAVGWDAMQELLNDGMVIFGGGNVPARKRLLSDHMTALPAPSFTRDRRASTLHLQKILGDKRFPNAKDHEVLMRWLRMACPQNGIVLDFFAGSGTTAEAVMRLNADDEGTRQSIIVTNNELGAKNAKRLRDGGHLPGDQSWEAEGVFQRVTRPRIETVASGIREDGSIYSEGLRENVAFYQLTYEDENLVALGRKFEAVAPLLWLKAGGVGDIVNRNGDEPWSVPRTAKYGVLFDTAHAKSFADEVADRADQLVHVFVVTDSESAFQTAIAYLPAELRVTTTRLYADYLHSFKINGRD
ncbi:site-specific DNA-methyltransferase [Rathayibacter sp. AY1D2]|uniref:site-specific DNA-methyltransferase n=1 Tax=Rathayibacter sp. AY1D2 TaxID=2080543 RepID=UPI000CE7ECA2|nr:site-specific DNA-methyltransferase [Rathayibacter sp. AY1D2]PPI18903.1 site-specific DNA-methyltransferase [Rathayibacter sp. AY1D2]